MSTITHIITSEIHHVNGFNRFQQFFLVPEKNKGKVSAAFQVFENFDELKRKLPKIIENLKFSDECVIGNYNCTNFGK